MSKKRIRFLLAGLLLACSSLAAQESLDLAGIIGMDLDTAFRKLGPPAEVFAVRGEQAWQDDVVFYYERSFYLFWYQNRVWQVRLDQRYPGEFFALKMGLAKEEVAARIGKPLKDLQDSFLYNLEDRGYPLRLRIFFEQGLLSDLYCYRGDF